MKNSYLISVTLMKTYPRLNSVVKDYCKTRNIYVMQLCFVASYDGRPPADSFHQFVHQRSALPIQLSQNHLFYILSSEVSCIYILHLLSVTYFLVLTKRPPPLPWDHR